jgi:hypothetical protein
MNPGVVRQLVGSALYVLVGLPRTPFLDGDRHLSGNPAHRDLAQLVGAILQTSRPVRMVRTAATSQNTLSSACFRLR